MEGWWQGHGNRKGGQNGEMLAGTFGNRGQRKTFEKVFKFRPATGRHDLHLANTPKADKIKAAAADTLCFLALFCPFYVCFLSSAGLTAPTFGGKP